METTAAVITVTVGQPPHTPQKPIQLKYNKNTNPMPVQFDAYDETRGRIDLSEGSNAHTILSFLAEHPDQGFTPTEIHEATEVPYGSTGPTLKRLGERDLVRHKEPYWAIGSDEALATYGGVRSTIEAIEARLGPEDPDDWLEHAEPVDEK